MLKIYILENLAQQLKYTNLLIKIKFNKNKSSKHELSNNIVKAVNCSLVTIIGNTLIVYKQSSNLKYRHIKI